MTYIAVLWLIIGILSVTVVVNTTLFIVLLIRLRLVQRMERLNKALLMEYDRLSKKPIDYNN